MATQSNNSGNIELQACTPREGMTLEPNPNCSTHGGNEFDGNGSPDEVVQLVVGTGHAQRI